jgi:cell division protein FtsL
MHSRIEMIASQQMQMQVPDAKRVQVVATTQASAPTEMAQDIKAMDIKSQGKAVH